jgi:hypothetical protein
MRETDEGKDAAPGRPAQDTSFRQAMSDAEKRCDQLAEQLDNQNTENAEEEFRGLAELFLAGREACSRVVGNYKPNSLITKAARRLLEAVYLRILDTWRRLHDSIGDRSRRNALDSIRMTLVQTMAQPLTGRSDDIRRDK